MFFYDINNKTNKVSFKTAVIEGINIKTGGTFMPAEFGKLSPSVIYRNPPPSFRDLTFEIMRNFCGGEIPDSDLMSIIAQFYPYKIPVNPLNQTTYLLELFHGPTCNYKDIGAGFFAYLLEYFNKTEDEPFNVILPASGERACAAGYAVSQVSGVRAVILFPEDSVTEIQKQQMAKHTKNVRYICVKGTFEDCENLIAEALADKDIQEKLKPIPGAGPLNIAPLLVQSVFFVYAVLAILYRCGFDNKIEKPSITASVPSGSFSNITAGLIAKKMGAPIDGFISAENENHTIAAWLKSGGKYSRKPPAKTNTPALDIPNPMNFKRMLEIYSLKELRTLIIPHWFNDEQTIDAVRSCNERTGYIIDPYGAIAWQSWQDILNPPPDRQKSKRKTKTYIDSCARESLTGLVLQTSHPAKFADIMTEAVGRAPSLPDRLEPPSPWNDISHAVISMEADYTEFKEQLFFMSE